ncbi:hypothetical protein [Variovorax boronicumulans]|uniref:hypothetical protein n=1 Tax=Variovorax boronicumulans TaxID=436515 RepID=UPI002786E8C1|nr:hypothetical protein [Variovorax boronicumulans]MDQ0044765.1 hypothetical protein [Variovorax boronicumulans]
MSTPLIPQEIYLLERYSSLDYFGEMRDAWASMVKAAEEALDQFMRKLPLDYRRRDLSRQPDIVWGERVLPNFRSTLESLNTGYILLSRGDLSALALGGNVMTNIKGQTSDYPADWMPKELEDRFWYWQGEAGTRAFNVSITEYAGWVMTDLTSRYSAQSRGILAAPPSWPVYRLNPAITSTTGQPVGRSGIYLPACDDSCAEVLIQGYDAFRARVGFDSRTTHSVSRAATTWTLVERIADSGGGVPGQEDSTSTIAEHSMLRRAPGGEACPQAGWWHTPAKTGSRRYFKSGEVMPVFEGSPYGTTIWQWDVDQSAPRL